MIGYFCLVLLLVSEALSCTFEKGSIGASCSLESVSVSPGDNLRDLLCNHPNKDQTLNLASGDYSLNLDCSLDSVVQLKGSSKEDTTITFTNNHMVLETAKLLSFENLTLKGSNTHSAQTNPTTNLWLINVDLEDFQDCQQSILMTSEELYLKDVAFKNIQVKATYAVSAQNGIHYEDGSVQNVDLEGGFIEAKNYLQIKKVGFSGISTQLRVVHADTTVSDCSMEDLTFTSIQGNSTMGAAITVMNSQVPVVIKNTLFHNCSNEKDSLVKVMDSTKLTLENTQVNSFTGSLAGAFEVYKVESVTIDNFSCQDCKSTKGNGGAIYYSLSEGSPKLELKNSNFVNCRAEEGSGGVIGIYSHAFSIALEMSLLNLTFSNVKAGMGAAISYL